MAYTKVSRKSYGENVTSSLLSLVIGLVLFIASTVLLFYNEGRAVKITKSIKEAEQVAVNIDDASTIDPEYNGKLVHISAMALTDDILSDDMFSMQENAIKLIRDVQYYQWVEKTSKEKRDKVGGATETITTYTYHLEWTDKPINSSLFEQIEYRESNFVLTPIYPKEEMATNVTLGAYKLPSFIISSIGNRVPVKVDIKETILNKWNAHLSEGYRKMNMNIEDSLDRKMVHIRENQVYFGVSPVNPNVGDLKVTFEKVLPADISILAKVINNTFEPYVAKNGKSFSSVMMGTVAKESMFQAAHSDNKTLTWMIRIGGVFLVIVSLKMTFSIVSTIFKVIPAFSAIIGVGVVLVCVVVGTAWSAVIIGISWFIYRPLLGLFMLVIAISGMVLLRRLSAKKKVEANNES